MTMTQVDNLMKKNDDSDVPTVYVQALHFRHR
jgi:hypothetical protein